MSGVGEALAIVSAVAGLIQAYDAGSRIVKQIKARRAAHEALPPSDLLEESIEKGRRQIVEVVADGNKRFGPSFEEGDTTAQLALAKITIETQNALLNGLTQARDDDGVIDFDTCIDTSDKGRVEALIALQQLFQRKLNEEMEKKQNFATAQAQSQSQQNPSPAPPIQSPNRSETQPVGVPKPEQTPPPTPPNSLPKLKKSKTFGVSNVFRRKESNEQSPTSSQKDIVPSTSPREPSPRILPQELAPRSPRRDTTASISSTGTWSSSESRSSLMADPTSARHTGCVSRSNTNASSMAPISRQSTALSTISTMSSMSAMYAMSGISLTSNMSSASTLAPITKYGGCCKRAFELREGSINKGLSLAPIGIYGKNMAYKCDSKKCHFSGVAIPDGKGYRLDDRLLKTSELQYRWLFLAKSHIQQQDAAKTPSFRCLVCMLLGDSSAIFHGPRILLSHFAGHQGEFLGEKRLAGPLVFTNTGVERDVDDFDILFPEVEEPPVAEPTPEPTSGHGVAVVVATRSPMRSPRTETTIPLKGSSSFAYEADDNPWA